jgi:hypothetical protein
MTIDDPFLFSFCVLIATIGLFYLFGLTSLFSKDRQQKRLLDFGIQVMAGTTMLFGFVHFAKSVQSWFLILYLVVFFANVYFRFRKLSK